MYVEMAQCNGKQELWKGGIGPRKKERMEMEKADINHPPLFSKSRPQIQQNIPISFATPPILGSTFTHLSMITNAATATSSLDHDFKVSLACLSKGVYI